MILHYSSLYLQNLIVLSVSFLLVFSAYSSIQNIEPSILQKFCSDCDDGTYGMCRQISGNECTSKDKFSCDERCPNGYQECLSSVGSISIGILCLAFMASSVFASAIVDKHGAKLSIFLGFVTIILFCIANIITSENTGNDTIAWITLVPVAMLVGLATPSVRTAQSYYITLNAEAHALSLNMPRTKVLGCFYGIFYSIYQLCQIFGNLVGSLLLREAKWSPTSLFVCYLCFAIVGTTLICFLRPVDVLNSAREERQTDRERIIELVAETAPLIERKTISSNIQYMSSAKQVISLCSNKKMTALIPLCIVMGLEKSFAAGAFTTHFLRPSLGEASIGYIMSIFGVANAVSSLFVGKLSDIIGRWSTLFIFSTALGVAYLSLAIVEIDFCDDRWWFLATIACMLGVGDATFNTIGNAIVGETFNSNLSAAFANVRIWEGAAAAFMYFLNAFMSGNHMAAMLLVLLTLAMATSLSVRLCSSL